MLREGADPLVAEIAVAAKTSADEALEVLESLVMDGNDEILARRGLVVAA